MLWTIAERADTGFRIFDASVFTTRKDARKFLRNFKMLNQNVETRRFSVRKLVVME